VLHKKDTCREHVGLEASRANRMRPAIYGAHPHLTAPGKESEPRDRVNDLPGSLCEKIGKFAIQRRLPEIAIGAIVADHDTGARGFSMGFNYNGNLRSAELLLKKDRTVALIRRAETIEDHFAAMIL
jgi:diaminopimelate decarboxylase